jgi:two-component system response regulator PilR (NtrC family)
MAEHTALVVDDEPDIRELLEITLGRMDIETHSAENLAKARQLLGEVAFDFCLTDMNLPDGNGIDLVQHISDEFPHLPVAMITAHGSMESAVDALKAGAFDFVSKPLNVELLRRLVVNALNLKPLEAIPKASPEGTSLLGDTQIMVSLRKQIAKLARSQAPIYVSGESGSGKELVARLIHEQGPHADAPFIPVNCGAIPSELMESEFFGHKKGSFTGASGDKEGLFQAANGGTLFLDEVADLPLPMQVKLLRAIQEKAVRSLGEQKEIPVDVRILSATHKDLASEVDAGNFRQDLYYRINVIELKVPSLRDRNEDIPLLAEHLLARIAADYQMEVPGITADAMQALQAYQFPGNVRELENVLERAFTLCENDLINPDDLNLSQGAKIPTQAVAAPREESEPDDESRDPADTETPSGISMPDGAESLDSYLEDIERNVIIEALEATRWNKTAAAKKLGITFRALRYKLKKLELE